MFQPAVGAVTCGVDAMTMGIDNAGEYGRIGRGEYGAVCDFGGRNNGFNMSVIHEYGVIVHGESAGA